MLPKINIKRKVQKEAPEDTYKLAALPQASRGFATIGYYRASPYDDIYHYEDLYGIECRKIRENREYIIKLFLFSEKI